MHKIDLESFQNGAVTDLFNEEMRKVLANIEDENTVADKERSVTIRIAVRPDKTRRTGHVTVQASSTLAKTRPAESLLFFDRDEAGNFSAYEDDPGPELPDVSVSQIRPFKKAVNGG